MNGFQTVDGGGCPGQDGGSNGAGGGGNRLPYPAPDLRNILVRDIQDISKQLGDDPSGWQLLQILSILQPKGQYDYKYTWGDQGYDWIGNQLLGYFIGRAGFGPDVAPAIAGLGNQVIVAGKMLGIKSLQGYDLNVLTKYPYDDSTDAMNETSGWIENKFNLPSGFIPRTPTPLWVTP